MALLAGMVKTLLLFVIPRKVVSVLKAEWRSWPGHAGGTAHQSVYQAGIKDCKARLQGRLIMVCRVTRNP